MKRGFLATAVALVMGSAGLSAQAPARPSRVAPASPAKLASGAAGVISATLGKDAPAYHARAVRQGFAFENARQRITANMTPAGVHITGGTVNWRLRFDGIDRGATHVRATSVAPIANANRVEYRRGSVTEWYVNGPMGLEQGFTIAAPGKSARRSPLVMRLSVSGDLQPRVDAEGHALTLADRAGHDVMAYRELAAWDAHGRSLPARLRFDRSSVFIEVDDAGAAYPVTIDPLIEQIAKLTPTDYDPGADNFGYSIAVEGDTIVVGGAKIDVPSGVYVFTKPAGGWAGTLTQVAKLTPSDLPQPFDDDTFGGSVDISADTIVTGASQSSVNGAYSQGAAYVFVKPPTGWTDMTETTKLLASDGQSGDLFGGSVAIAGDTIVSGAYTKVDATNGNPAGAVYVFVKPSAGWGSAPVMTETARLAASDGSGYGNALGYAVAIGNDTVVASAPADGPVHDGRQAGAAYVFLKPATGWSGVQAPATKLVPPGSTNMSFGYRLGIDKNTGGAIVISAPYVRPSYAYLFVRPAAGWATTPPATLSPTTTLVRSDGSEFAWSVAVDGDRVVTGVVSSTLPGAVYVYDKPANGWPALMPETLRLVTPEAAADDAFGTSVAIRDQLIAVGERGPLVNNIRVPAAYVFGPPTSGDTTSPDVQCSGGATGWTNANVTVACTASDSGTGLANPADASFQLSTAVAAGVEDSAAMTDSRSVCDAATPQNCITVQRGPFMVDRKAPTITLTSPLKEGAYVLAQPVSAGYGCVDGGSGSASCTGTVPSGSSIDTASVGTKSFTVNASDQVGNTATPLNRSYTVSFAVKTLSTNRSVTLRLEDFLGMNRSSASIALTIQSIDNSPVVGETFAFKNNNSYKYTPPSGFNRGMHTVVFVATGDPVAHTVNFTY